MSFNTNIPNHVLIGDDDIIFGTSMLGDDFGQIKKCDLERTGKEIEIENNRGSLRAVILTNPGFALDLEVEFDSSVQPPAFGDPITFPYAGVIGRVMPGAKISWEAGGSRTLSFKAAHWDSMAVPTVPNGNILTNPAVRVAINGTSTPIV
jgi:hypothetical protein